MLLAKRAVIDVGTNSVKLLVAEVHGETVRPLLEESKQTRLGCGFYETHELQPKAIEETADAVAKFARQAEGFNPQQIRVIATSAARDAKNCDELLAAIRKARGLAVEVISGDQEAEWVFRGVCTEEALHGHKLMIVDVGGGSTEIIVGEKGHHKLQQSLALGSVRLLERIHSSDPPTLEQLQQCRQIIAEFLKAQITPEIARNVQGRTTGAIRLVGTGGTASLLVCMQKQLPNFDRDVIENTPLAFADVAHWMERLWALPLEERRKLVGLPPNRADIIPFGVAIYEALMNHFGFEQLHVSTRGLRFGALLDEN